MASRIMQECETHLFLINKSRKSFVDKFRRKVRFSGGKGPQKKLEKRKSE